MIYTLKSFNTGQITLPKARRSKFSTNNFVAEETPEGLLIKPLQKDGVVYYEDQNGRGIYAEEGVDIAVLKQKLEKIIDG